MEAQPRPDLGPDAGDEPRSRGRAAAGAAGALLVAGAMAACTGGAPGAAGTADPAAPRSSAAVTTTDRRPGSAVATVPCDQAIDWIPAVPTDLEVVIDTVALPTRRLLAAYETREPGRLSAKQGLVVRAGATVEIVVASPAADHAGIAWGNAGPPERSVRVAGCTAAQDWLAFAGGYTVDAPMCLPLIVRSAGREARVSVSVGAPCRSSG